MKKWFVLVIPALMTACFMTTEDYRFKTSPKSVREAHQAAEDQKARESGAPIGVSHKVLKSVFLEHNEEGVYLGIDASYASTLIGSGYEYLPIGVYIANRTKGDLHLTETMLTYKTSEEWSAFPDRSKKNGSWVPVEAASQVLGREPPFEVTFQDMGKQRINSYILRGYYAAAIMYIHTPDLAHLPDTQFVRLKDSETGMDIQCGFLLREKK